MKYGITMFPTDYAIPVTELAHACEDLGFESLFVPEHTHIPASRRTPYPYGPSAGRRRAAEGVFAHARPVRRAGGGGGGDDDADPRHRHLSRGRA